ncbi:MAG: hypothetical protein C0595_10430 [Marinilabiliales bacterium]|nr:MAG: hypothetical protein C0595_10430 [Marinilabiliales bacterium]
MKRFHFQSIKIRILFWFLILSIIPLISTLTITYFERVDSIKRNEFAKLTAIRDLKVNEISNWLNERLGDINVIAGDYELRKLENIFNKETKSREEFDNLNSVHKLLDRFIDNYYSYDEVFVVNPISGIVEISTNNENLGKNEAHEKYFKNIKTSHETYIQDVFLSNTTKTPEMIIAKPILCMSHNKHIVGILVVQINLNESLFKLLRNDVGLGQTGETLIVNSDSMAIHKLKWYEDAPLKLKITAEPAAKAVNGQTGIIESEDYHNERVLAAYTYIPAMKWGFVAKQNLAEVYKPISNMLWNFMVIFLLTSLVIIILALKLSNTITKPILAINKIAKSITGGNYSARINIKSNDELGSLSRELNKMADKTESMLKLDKNTAKITQSMIGKTKLKDLANSLLKRLMKISNANMSTFFILNEENKTYEIFESIGAKTELIAPFSAENPEGEFANVISTKSIFYHKNIPDNSKFYFKTVAGEVLPKEIISIPIMDEDDIVAIISLININKFDDQTLAVLRQTWTNINVFYSNLSANEKTKILVENLSIVNQKLEAQSEELQEQAEELQEQAEELRTTTNELQHQNIELEAQKKQVESATKLKSEFLSNMSHELRTPLNSILALSHVLIQQTKDKLEEEEYSYLKIVERNGKNLLKLINGILDLSKIEAGRMEINTSYFSVIQMLKLVCESLKPLANNKNLDLKLMFDENLPKINSDELKLHQVFTNIINNSIKFTEKGTVEIKAAYIDDKIRITVKDTGIGISKNDLQYIFEEFRQSDGTNSRKFEGTGLGLAIADKLVEILGGEISVESEVGKGSTFTVNLPLNWENPNETQKFNSKNKTIVKNIFDEVAKKENVDYSDKVILIVDDNKDSTQQLKHIVIQLGIKAEIANDGKEALKIIKQTKPDGIILDLMMPDVDGFKVIDQLVKNDYTKDIPIIILTAKDLSSKDMSRLSQPNIRQIIQKGDINFEQLQTNIKQILYTNTPKHLRGNQTEKTYETPIKKDNLNIFIISNNKDNATTINALLKDYYEEVKNINIDETIIISNPEKDNILLFDMPTQDISKSEVLNNLKFNKKVVNLPIIAISAKAMTGDKEKFISLGFDGYISMPIDINKLTSEINKVI